MHLTNLHFHTPTSTFFIKRSLHVYSAPTVILNMLFVSHFKLIMLNLGMKYLYHWKADDMPFNRTSILILFTEGCQWFWWILICIFLAQAAAIFCDSLPSVKHIWRELTQLVFTCTGQHIYLCRWRNNEMLPCDRMDYTEIGTSTIGHYTQDMSLVWVQGEKVKWWLWTNT